MEIRTLRATGVFLLVVLIGCSSTSSTPPSTEIMSGTTVRGQSYPYGSTGSAGDLVITTTSTDPEYAFTPQKAVRVAGLAERGPRAEVVFLSALRGPKGEELRFVRQGACCPFETSSSDLGTGLLDVYEVTYEGLSEPLILYLNMYDKGDVFVPVGLTGAK